MEATSEVWPVHIYALVDDTGIRYVGQTRRSLDVRLAAHLADRRTWSAVKTAWLADLRSRGLVLCAALDVEPSALLTGD